MERVALGANGCWFKAKDPAFADYRLAPELNSFSGRPRILIVPATRRNRGRCWSSSRRAARPVAGLRTTHVRPHVGKYLDRYQALGRRRRGLLNQRLPSRIASMIDVSRIASA